MIEMLIVGENVIFRQAIKDLLASKFPSMCLVEAENAEEALRKIDANCPDLILMDVKLPGQNGLELTRGIKIRYPQVVIIILADYDLPEYREAATEHGADYFLAKGSTKAKEILVLAESISSGVGSGCELPEIIDITLEGLRLPNINESPDKFRLEQKHEKEVPRTAGSTPSLGILHQIKELDSEGK